jgi:ABC-type nickel/cobalt efflux system permease component RcnA
LRRELRTPEAATETHPPGERTAVPAMVQSKAPRAQSLEDRQPFLERSSATFMRALAITHLVDGAGTMRVSAGQQAMRQARLPMKNDATRQMIHDVPPQCLRSTQSSQVLSELFFFSSFTTLQHAGGDGRSRNALLRVHRRGAHHHDGGCGHHHGGSCHHDGHCAWWAAGGWSVCGRAAVFSSMGRHRASAFCQDSQDSARDSLCFCSPSDGRSGTAP